jgi:hypothetical protein
MTEIEISIDLELRSNTLAENNLHGDPRTAPPKTNRARALDRPTIISTVAQAR